MFNKIKIKYLIIVFGGLLALVLLTVPAGNRKKNRSFDSEITNFETNQVENILKSLSGLRAKRLAATGKEGWEKYEVTDSLGTRVELFIGDRVVADLYIGKFSYTQPTQPVNPYQQAQGTMTSFVRNHKEKEVYAVDGYLGMSFNRQLKEYRDGNILRFNATDLKSVFLSQSGEQFSLMNSDTLWTIEGVPVDSSFMADYLSDIRSLRSMNFLTTLQYPTGNPTRQLKLEGENGEVIARIDGYFSDSTHMAIGTSMNQGTFFDGTRSDLFKKLFRARATFVP